MPTKYWQMDVPEGETVVAGVVIRQRPDGEYAVQPFYPADFSARMMIKVLAELLVSMKLEADWEDDVQPG